MPLNVQERGDVCTREIEHACRARWGMVAILVLMTFVIFVLVDYYFQR